MNLIATVGIFLNAKNKIFILTMTGFGRVSPSAQILFNDTPNKFPPFSLVGVFLNTWPIFIRPDDFFGVFLFVSLSWALMFLKNKV